MSIIKLAYEQGVKQAFSDFGLYPSREMGWADIHPGEVDPSDSMPSQLLGEARAALEPDHPISNLSGLALGGGIGGALGYGTKLLTNNRILGKLPLGLLGALGGGVAGHKLTEDNSFI